MKRVRRGMIVLCVLAAMLCLAALPVQAKTIRTAKKSSLTDVRKAPEKKGKWIRKDVGVFFWDNEKGLLKSRWIRVKGSVYYLDLYGRRVSGWLEYRGDLYYMKKNGQMQIGWLRTKNKAFYLKAAGKMATGKKTIDGATYYFDKQSGEMQTGWIRIGKYDHYFAPGTGKMKKSCWVQTDKKYYYVDANGRKQPAGWLTVGKKKYYLDESGARVTGKQYIGDKGYFFKANGEYDPSVKVPLEVDPNKKMVALTFDDGPGIYTDRLLNCLQANGAKATFFLVGSSVPRYKNTVKRMATMGCELGNHSYSHPAFTTLSAASRASQVSMTNKNIYDAAGKYPTLFRLPYGDGHSNSSVLNALGLPSIYWSVDTRDWANTGNPQHTINAVLNSVKNGDIILMHDIHRSTVTAAETIIPELKRRGYQMVTVSQLAKYKGKTTLQTGKTYYNFW